MKKVQLVMSVVAVCVDYIALVGAGLASYGLRYLAVVQEVRPVIFDLPYTNFLRLTLIVATVWILIFALAGLYTTTYRQRIGQELVRVLVACSLGFVSIITFLFWSRELFSSRFILLVAWICAIVFVAVGRIGLRLIRRWLLTKGHGVTRVALIGADRATRELAAYLKQQPVWGYQTVLNLPTFDTKKITTTISRIDEVVVADVGIDRDLRVLIHDFCIANHLGFRYVADMFDAQSHNISIQTIAGFPIVEIKKTRLDGWGRIYKRLFDIIVGGLALLAALPLMLIIALLIYLDDQGTVLYINERVGKNGTLFQMYKFRYLKMKYCTGPGFDIDGSALQYEKELIKTRSNRTGGLYKIVDDPRRTRVGKYLERYSLDELPQLINVVLGSMSLVGPRPHQLREVEQFPKNHQRVHAIKPGITGMAQISGRSDLDVVEELRLDTLYIENWSLWSDILIIFKTPAALIRKRSNTNTHA